MIKNETFCIRFSNPMTLSNESDVICAMDSKLSSILHHCQSAIKHKLSQSKTADEFIQYLYSVLLQTLDLSSIHQPICSSYYYAICRELDVCGWHLIDSISPQMTQFVLNTKPSSASTHKLHFKVIEPNNFPNTAPLIVSNSLPLPFEFEWTTKRIVDANEESQSDEDEESEEENEERYNHILNVMTHFIAECKKYKKWRKIFDDFYENCIVLEPINKKYSCHSLKILVEKESKTMIEIELNPKLNLCQTQRPKIKFYGTKAMELKQRWNESEVYWNENVFPRVNIERILDVQFDCNDDGENVNAIISDLECSMCLEFKTESDVIPSEVCKECTNAFHRHCLLEWFNSLDSVKRRYTSIEGKCPHCSKNLTIPLID